MDLACKQAEFLSADQRSADSLAVFQIRGRATPQKSKRLLGLAKQIEEDIKGWNDGLETCFLLEEKLSLRSFKLEYLAGEGELLWRRTMDNYGVYISREEPKTVKLSTKETLLHRKFHIDATDIYLHVLLGDILIEPTNVIVSSANERFSQKGGVAGSIATWAGPDMNIEGKKLLAEQKDNLLPAGSAIITGAYNIENFNPDIQFVVHAVAPNNCHEFAKNQYYRKAIRSALEKAHEKRANIVSMPLVGAGLQHRDPHLCAEQIVLALAEWIGSKQDQMLHLKKVILIDRVENNANAMFTALENFAKNRQILINKMRCPHHVIAGMLTMADVTNVATISVVPDISSLEEFVILGPSSNVEKAKAYVALQLEQAITIKTFNLFDERVQMSKEQIQTHLRAKFLFEGINAFVSPLVNDSQSIEICSVGDVTMNKALVIFHSYLRECEQSVNWPENWPEDFDVNFVGHYKISVRKFSEQWLCISDEFRGRPGPPMGNAGPRNMFMNEITKIEMIINPTAFRSYHKYAEEIAKSSNAQDSSIFIRANEWWMKHGSGKTEPSEIANSDCGLNFNFHVGSNAFGRGAYLAEDASYVNDSCKGYELADGIHAQMFLVQVAAGSVKELTHRSDDHASLKAAPLGFNSIRGSLTRDWKGIITYRQNSTYPAYLITYKKIL